MLLAPFHPAHLLELRAQPRQPKDLALFADPEYGRSLAEGEAFSVFDAAGTLQGCLGVFPFWEGRGVCWAVLGAEVGPLLGAVTRAALTFFARSRYVRLEAYVDPTFPQAIRWIELLGFECETPKPMRQFTPSGADMLLYARIR